MRLPVLASRMVALAMELLLLMALAPRPVLAHEEPSGATVVELQARIDTLERRLAAIEGAAKSVLAAPLPSPPRPPTAPQTDIEQPGDRASQAASAADDMMRALERALVREGGLLLPPSVVELEPRWNYLHRASTGLEVLSAGGQPQLAQIDRRWEAQQAALGIRVGLPLQTQLDLLLPYASIRQQQIASGAFSSSETVSGFGGVEVGLNGQLLPASAGLGMVGSLRWIEPGSAVFERGEVHPVSAPYQALQASLQWVKRLDPVVFVGALSYAAARSQRIAGHAIDPGDTVGLRAGAIIALSPDISLRLALALAHSGSTRIDGTRIKGSGGISGEFSSGFSFVLSPRVLLGVEAGIGLTTTSPDFRVGLSLPIRF